MKILECAICGSREKTTLLYKESILFDSVDKEIFSARRIPDKIHYRLLKCLRCGLAFSSPILSENKIKLLYRHSNLTYETEIPSLKKTYGHYLRRTFKYLPANPRLLEIGGGNGFFLEEALANRITDVWGVEPSPAAVSKAKADIKKRMIIDFFPTKKIKPNSVDIICFFQTMDHIINPNQFLAACFKALKKGGIVLCIQHDTNGLSVKLLGERSPIFDIEHIYLFNKSCLDKIFSKNGFTTLEVFNVENNFPLRYWVQMFPLPTRFKKFFIKFLKNFHLSELPLKLPAGNIGIIAQKV